MKMHILLLLLMNFVCFSKDQSFVLYKGKMFRLSENDANVLKNIRFDKRNSVLEFAFNNGFMLVRMSDNVYKLMSMPKPNSINHLLEEEIKIDFDLKQI